VDWINDDIAVGGGTIEPDMWHSFQAESEITAVVNMRAEQQDWFSNPLPIAYLWLPVIDHTDPALGQLLLGAQFVDTAVRIGHKVLVHCAMGIGRSRTMVAAHMIWTGLSVDEAITRAEGTASPTYRPERRQVLETFAALLKQGAS
jgi:hypothetical protein